LVDIKKTEKERNQKSRQITPQNSFKQQSTEISCDPGSYFDTLAINFVI